VKTAIVLCTVLGCFHGLANACTILNKRQVRIGVEQGIEGNCANNGERIACTLSQDEGGINCVGPGGSYNGPNMGNLVFSACGCNGQQSEQRRLEQQLEDYP